MRHAAPSATQNLLLAALPRRDFRRLARYLEPSKLAFGQVLYEPSKAIRQVYFPCDSVISLLAVVGPGKSAEVAMVGREGVVGGFAALGIRSSPLRAVVQRTGIALRMAASRLERELRENGPWFRELFRLTLAQMNEAAISAACNRFHTVEARLARWLLTMNDYAGAGEFLMSHDSMATMLGVRRVSVTDAAHALRAHGLISYQRGRINVLDKAGLGKKSCECYRFINKEYETLYGAVPKLLSGR